MTAGLSGDLGWGDVEPEYLGPLGGPLLALVTLGYFVATWLLSGLPPLAFAAGRACTRRSEQS